MVSIIVFVISPIQEDNNVLSIIEEGGEVSRRGHTLDNEDGVFLTINLHHLADVIGNKPRIDLHSLGKILLIFIFILMRVFITSNWTKRSSNPGHSINILIPMGFNNSLSYRRDRKSVV